MNSLFRVAGLFFIVLLQPAVASQEWRTHEDAEFGFRFSYPSQIFVEEKYEPPAFRYFASPSEDAKLVVGAWDNTERQTPAELKRWMLANAEPIGDVTYEPHGRSWFVVSGYRDDKIFYQKVIVSCGGRVANLLGISYPTASRDTFDQVVERMEDTFKPGLKCPS